MNDNKVIYYIDWSSILTWDNVPLFILTLIGCWFAAKGLMRVVDWYFAYREKS